MGTRGLGAAELDGPGADGPLLAFLRLLSDGAGPDVIGAGLAEGLLREARPNQVSVYLLDESGECLEERVRYGPPPEPDHLRVPLGVPLPATEVFRTGRSGAWTMAAAAVAFPPIAGWVRSQPDRADDEVFVVPVRAQGRPVGVLLVSLPRPAERSWHLGRSMDAAATALGLWSLTAAPRTGGRPRRRASRGVEVSPRQSLIVDDVRAGRSNAQIAADLRVSVGTVKSDLAALYRRFGVSDREALAGLVAASRPSAPPRTATARRR